MNTNTPSGVISHNPAFDDLLKIIEKNELPASALGITSNAKPYFPLALYENTERPVIFITPTEQTARAFAANCGGSANFYPDSDLNLRTVDAKSREGELERIGLFKNSNDKKLIFMSAKAAASKVIPKSVFNEGCLTLITGETYDMEFLLKSLVKNGYERAGTVYSKGEFAKRGEIIDIYPSDSEKGLRITFFDDEIESIKFFDPDTQKSVGKNIGEYKVPPAREVILNDDAKKRIRNYLNKHEANAKAADEISYEIEEFGAFETANTFLSVLYEEATILDYFDDPLIIFDDFGRVKRQLEADIREFEDEFNELLKSGEVFSVQKNAFTNFDRLIENNKQFVIDMPEFEKSALPIVKNTDFKLRSSAAFGGRMGALAQSLKDRVDRGFEVILFAGAKAESLSKTLTDLDIIAPVASNKTNKPGVTISRESLAYGFENTDNRILALGTNDIFGRVKKKNTGKKRSNAGEDIFSDLKPGDIVVHDIHGKGRYLGLKTMKAAGNLGEYMEIEYKGGDKLYISTAQIERVHKYIGGDDDKVQLSKLGGKEWENAKAKVRESALKLAFDMVDLYSSRFEGEGYAFSPDTVWQTQFEDAFEYEETEGQEQSIAEIKKDMEAPRVMDRLLLGDVGYGKTEVAMRAAMKAVLDGKQVAVLVPTTLLARQHLETFRKRFEGFPVHIEGLTRFSKSNHKQIIDNVKSGKTDIIIGTHRLLSNDVGFHDLGLLIIDEEQRFGVNAKEKIKVMKKAVDVLTLSATPIPRTLEMSLTGIRDISTIDTPPAMRVEPKSYVTRYSDGLITDAIRREISRGGQVYFVCRKISEMDKLIADISKNVPEARVAAAHGQMDETQMENVVSDFIDGKYDVLVCTTIIESGIDIPAVNTIIVYEADKFGLSQLYQLKGRVGRADQTSYAYFTYNGEGPVNETAAKRLAAIKEFTQLGSGFKIAMRDLQIRGAGNLMGAEQSGHMATVGYAMYVKLMNEAVKIARGKTVEPEIETSVELDIPALIPDQYIQDQTDKMDIYRLISRVKTGADAKAAGSEIADRYGKLPQEVNNLLIAAVIKNYASQAGLASVIKKDGKVELKYSENVSPNIKKILKVTEPLKNKVILGAQTPMTISYKTDSKYPTKGLLELLAALKIKKSA